MDLRQLHAAITERIRRGEHAAALALLQEAPADDLNFLMLRGGIALATGDADTAETAFQHALRQRPGWPPVLANLTQVAILRAAQAENRGDQTAANEFWQQAVARGALFEKRDPAVISNLWLGRRKLWDWRQEKQSPLPAFSETDLTPAAATVLSDDPAFQRRVAEQWCGAHLPPAASRPARISHTGPLRVGYLSSDLHHHATAYLIAELFALHDPAQVEAFCFSYGAPDESAIRQRIIASTPHFIDLHGLSQPQQLQRLRAARLDILVDLKGHTRGGALPLLSQRVAAVQIHYLGHPGTIGHDAIDYLVGDGIVTPPGCEAFYSERLIRLPGCYQINDRQRQTAPALPAPLARSAYGLPDDKLVLGCFNQSYKLTPEVFADWVAILNARPGTVLWLYNNVDGAEANLRAHAGASGIGPERIVFAGPLPNDAHLARYRAADLILDTYPYTSHTTGSDALWAGVPLVTRCGETYPSRVAASLLHAVGLPELVTETPAAYRQLVLDLIDDAPRRAQLRQYLQDARTTAPLWDTVQWVKNWEAALLAL